MDFRKIDELYEEEEDAAFYDELRRQVLQLTAEDDVHEKKTPKVRKQLGSLYGVTRTRCYYYDWPGIKEDCATAPAWMLGLWRSGNGTGVFIPRAVQSTRKNISRRTKNEGVMYRPKARTN